MSIKVREVIRAVERAGWQFVRQHGSHRQYHHPFKPGTVTVSGHEGHDMPERTLSAVLRQAGMTRRDLR
jgi:predicted RNA binding protein YcfA (HicA-like mRNA interferase family)